MTLPVFHHEIEDRPLRAVHGVLQVRGWCLAQNEARPPAVRLLIRGTIAPAARRLAREDVQRIFHAPAGARDCGFVFAARVPAGVCFAHIEASVDGEQWHLVKRLSLVATPDRLQAIVEQPESGRPVRASTRILGWCAHADYDLAEVQLHYGDKKVPCDYGLPRSDVPGLLPGAPNAALAGFITKKNIPVGFGPLRIRAVARTGEILLAATTHQMDVELDEDHPRPVQLRDPPLLLGPARRPLPPGVHPAAATPLRILFVLYGDFTSNSAIHVVNLAGELQRRGHHCTVAVPAHKETALYFRSAGFTVLSFGEALAPAGRGHDIVHAWTTRESVRKFWAALPGRGAARLIIHLEDHEPRLLEMTLGRSSGDLLALPPAELDRLVPPNLSHPRHSQEFLRQADGITVILDKLRELAPADKPVQVVWPAAEASAFFPRPRPLAFRRALGCPDDHTVLFYHGNVHAANAAEVRELYAAVLELNRRGHSCTLIRLGRDTGDFLGELAGPVAPHVLALGLVPHHDHVAPLLALADYFVQPGGPDTFNDYRFPSKLPEFFSVGRPVILPRTNLGLLTRHGKDAYVTECANCAGIVQAVIELQCDPALRTRLAEGALEFARRHFDWARSARALDDFYRRVLSPG